MKCEASEALITSTAKMLAAYSWARRWNWRSEPVRSIRTAMPGYFASKPRATRSDTGKSMAAYQTALPSFLAASMSAGVTGLDSGAAARAGRAAAPESSPVTPALIEAARKEGNAVWYAAMDLPVSERVARGFEAKYPGIAVRIERTGSERQFQRLAQEYAANIFAVDVINASDASHFIAWKRNGWLAPYVPED